MKQSEKKYLHSAEKTAERQRELQADNASDAKTKDRAPQTGARDYPVPPFPQQHLEKPGEEWELQPKPMYDAPFYKGSQKLENKVVIITGGDSGIGRAVATLCAREGATIVIIYLEETADAEGTAEQVRNEGSDCLLIKGNVQDLKFCENAVERVVKSFGKVDVLINNAAFQLHSEAFKELSPEQFDETMKTNLYGYFNMAKAVLPYLGKGASIINTGSVTGLHGSKNLIDYSMTKGGIHAFTRSLAGNLLPDGIRVNAVAPGPVWTPLNPADKCAPDIEQFGANTPMKRPAQPEELAPIYVFLASAQCSSYITGEIIPVIGGY